MNANRIQYFLSAVEEKSFTGAARKYFVSQAAVTQQIAAIEKELDVQLFVRKSNGIEVTEAGRYLYEEMKQLIGRYQKVTENLGDFQREHTESFTVGISQLQDYEWISPLLRDIRRMHAQMEFHLAAGEPKGLLERLKQGRLSLLVTDNPVYEETQGMEILPAYHTGISLVVPAGSALAGKSRLRLEDLKEIPLILAGMEGQMEGAGYWEFYRICRNVGFTPHVAAGAANYLEALILVDEGAGTAVFMEDITSFIKEHSGMKILRLEAPGIVQKFLMYRREDETLEMKRVLKYLIRAGRERDRGGRADLKEDFALLWQEALKRDDGTYSQRLSDDQAEIDFWHRFMEKRKTYQQDPWAVKMSSAVCEVISGLSPETVLEIGPGWGNYTMDLADICRELTCLDISPDVLRFINRWSRELGKTEINTVCCKWEDFEADRKYDVIFGYNCFYRMLHLRECLEKMDRMAGKMCIIGMGMGEIEKYYLEMEEQLGVRLVYDKKDYIYFVNILYQMGIDANVKVIPLLKDISFGDWDQVVQYGTSCLYNRQDEMEEHGEKIEKILRKYFIKKQDGNYHYRYDYRGTLVYWKPGD